VKFPLKKCIRIHHHLPQSHSVLGSRKRDEKDKKFKKKKGNLGLNTLKIEGRVKNGSFSGPKKSIEITRLIFRVGVFL
jgi:hypothetical protein